MEPECPLSERKSPGTSRRKKPARVTSGICTKPMSEGIYDAEASSAAAEILLIVRRKGGKEELDSAFARYDRIIRRVAERFPEEDLWEVERHSLPPSLLNQVVCVPGLPRCTVPISYLGWQNPELEQMLDARAPQNGIRTGYTRLISRILDRYVQCFFPIDQVDGFFKSSVMTLHTLFGQSPVYEETVVALARKLAEGIQLIRSDTENNPLKTPVHKSIPTETGDRLSEHDSSSHKRIFKRAQSDHGKRFIGPSIAISKGLTSDVTNVHPLLGARLGVPGCEKDLRDKALKALPGRDELMACMSLIIRPGAPESFGHPALPGMEFPESVCKTAVLVANVAQRKLSGDDSALSALIYNEIRPAKALCSLPEFRSACENRDRPRQMSIALEACALDARASDLSVRFGIADAYSQAAKDIETARGYVAEYQEPPKNPSMILRGVRQMQELSRMAENLDSSPYELALQVIDERHRKKEPLATIKPPEGAAPPASEVAIPRPSLVPKDLAVPPAPDEAGAAGPEATAVEAPAGGQDGADSLQAALDFAAEPVPEPQSAAEQAPEAAASPAPAPAEQPAAVLPAFDFPFPNHILDPELEPHLPPKTDKRNGLIRKVSRGLVSYIKYGYDEENVDPRCLEAVRALKTCYSQAAVVAFAVAIVDGKPLPAVAPARVAPTLIDVDETGSQVYASNAQAPQAAPVPVAPTLIDAEVGDEGQAQAAPAESASETPDVAQVAAPPALILTQLENHEKEMVAAVMAVPSCDVDALTRFMALAPARRELLVEGYIASLWTEGDFRSDIPRMRRAKETLYLACGVRVPTDSEKLAEITDPANLLKSQKGVLSRLFNVAEQDITPKHVEAFAVWASSDPSYDSGRERLARYWNDELVVTGAKGFNLRSGLWMSPSLEDRRRFYHAHSFDPISVGLLAHRLRFGEGTSLSLEETMAVCRIYGKSWAEASSLQDQAKENLALALTHHVFDISSSTQLGTYYPEQLAASKSFALNSIELVKAAAREGAEYSIMLDFLGIAPEGAEGRLIHTHGTSRAKRVKGVDKPNDDSWSSCVVSLSQDSDFPDISLDMVADGMGGHNQGGNGGKTNGQIASGTAKDVFDIAAVAGWIRTPEDVRKVILIADQAVVAEQVRKKAERFAHATVAQRWAASGVDVNNMHPEWAPEFEKQVGMEVQNALNGIDARQLNNMGTTMVVALQRGDKLWFIHCGDSDGKLIRDGTLAFATEGHSMEYQMRLHIKETVREEMTLEHASRGVDVRLLQGEELAGFEKALEAEYESRVANLAELFRRNGNVVCSVLGVKPLYVKINNLDSGYKPITAGTFDIIEISSDGKSVPVCDHETPLVAFKKCMGGLDAARTALVELAASRGTRADPATKEAVPYTGLLCQCSERVGKTDDITLIMRHAEEGILEHRREYFTGGEYTWLARRMADSPAELALSRSLRLVVEGATDPQTAQEDVLRLFDAIIKNAERSPARTSRETYAFAISLISSITAARHDREEIIDALVPTLGSWSGLMLKKLRECPDSSARRRVMFDIVARSVPSGELQPLLRAANPEVAAWAGQATGLPPETAPAQFPRSIFNSQTGIGGEALDPYSTRYLDVPVLEIFGSSVVQDTARRLGILPRDLEVMAFYAYSDYDPETSLNPHEAEAGDSLIATVGMHLCTGDAERILVASSILWKLREWTPGNPAESRRLAKELWDAVGSMNQDAPYAVMFHAKAFQYRGLLP